MGSKQVRHQHVVILSLLQKLGLDAQILTSNPKRLTRWRCSLASTFCVQKHHAGPSGWRDTENNVIHALPRIPQSSKSFLFSLEQKPPTQADINKQRHLFSYVIETVEVALASGVASPGHVSAGFSVFLPLWGYIPAWVDIIIHNFPSSRLPFLKSPNRAQEIMALFSRNPGGYLLLLCWPC